MWLQWVVAAPGGGAGWAFYEPNGALASTTGAPARPPAIATQRASLAEFLAQVEGRFVGFGELAYVAHNGTTLWSRAAAAGARPATVVRGGVSEAFA